MKKHLLLLVPLILCAGCNGNLGGYREKPPEKNAESGRFPKPSTSPVEILTQDPARPFDVIGFATVQAMKKAALPDVMRERARELGGDAVIVTASDNTNGFHQTMSGKVIAWK